MSLVDNPKAVRAGRSARSAKPDRLEAQAGAGTGRLDREAHARARVCRRGSPRQSDRIQQDSPPIAVAAPSRSASSSFHLQPPSARMDAA